MNRRTTFLIAGLAALVLLLALSIFQSEGTATRQTVADPPPTSDLPDREADATAGQADSRKQTGRPGPEAAATSVQPLQQSAPRGPNNSRTYAAPETIRVSEAAQAAPPVTLASPAADGRAFLLPEETDLHTLSARRMELDRAALDRVASGERGRILAPLPDGGEIELRIDTVRRRSATTQTFLGRIEGEDAGSDVQIVYHDGIVHGSVARYDTGEHYEYRILASGHLMVRRLDPSTMTAGCGNPGEEPPAVDEHPAGDDTAAPSAEYIDGTEPTPLAPLAEATAGADEVVAADTPGYETIDLVVGYGIEARQADGGVSQIEARIIASVDRMNSAFANSQVTNTETMLLGTIEDPVYNYPGAVSGDMGSGDELGDLNSTTDGVLDAVSDYASFLGADLKSFVIKQADGSAGIAYKPGSSSVTARDYMTSTRITFAHELGHNIGCDHSWGDTSTNVNAYNYGWRLDPPSATRVRTIMAYDWGWGNGHRIPYYANPDVEYLGARTGAVDGYNVTGDTEADQRYADGGLNYTSVSGFDGTNPNLGARQAHYILERVQFTTDNATRTAFAVADPAGSEQWAPGETHTIHWTGGDYTDATVVELYKGGVFQSTIASGFTAENRFLDWTIPGGQAPGGDYTIRVALNGTETADSGNFTISVPAPRVVAQSPDPSALLPAGQSSLTLTFSEAVDTASFDAADDIHAFTGPQGADLYGTITGTSWGAGDTELTVQFASQSAPGYYRLVLGPQVLNPGGNPMDQDADTSFGEPLEDRYTAWFRIESGAGGPGAVWSDLDDTDDSPEAGWATGSGWAFGPPAEDGVNGPSAASSGTVILAQNLAGDYAEGTTATAESPVIDCSGVSGVSLSFKGWLGLGKNDEAYVEVFDGSTWQRIFSRLGPNFGDSDGAWLDYGPYDLSAYADGNATVQIRWALDDETKGNSGTQTGWQIDGIVLAASAAEPPPPAPVVLSHSPSGATEDPQSSFLLEFSQPMDTGSFDLGDIVSFDGPSGAIGPSGFAWISDSLLRIDFPAQSADGAYTLLLGPAVLDAFGQALDQDLDATAGESPDDRYTAAFSISTNQTPTGLDLSPRNIDENQPVGTVVGTLSTSDPDAGDSHTYSLVSGTGDDDNAAFSISGDQLLAAASFDFETQSGYSVRVRSTDSGALFAEAAFNISVDDLPDTPPSAPTGLVASATGTGSIELNWADNAGDETGYRVERATASGGPWTALPDLGVDAVFFEDSGLTSGTDYFYRVFAFNAYGDSTPDGEATATTWTPAQNWRQQYFGDTANIGDGADDYDFDKDGLANLLERAFATDPTDADSWRRPVQSIQPVSGDHHLAISYDRLSGGTGTAGVNYAIDGLTYTVEGSGDLTGPWASGPDVVEEILPLEGRPDNGDGTEKVTVRLEEDLATNGNGFIRLKVTGAE